MRKITDEGFLFLYGAGLLVTAETGIPAVITFARHGRALTGESPEHAQIVGSV